MRLLSTLTWFHLDDWREGTGPKQVCIKSTGAQKRHTTAVLACTSAGKMLPPMIIFKGNTICAQVRYILSHSPFYHTGKTAQVIKGLTAPTGSVIVHQSKA